MMDGGKRRSETVKLASPANLDHVIYGLNPTLVPGYPELPIKYKTVQRVINSRVLFNSFSRRQPGTSVALVPGWRLEKELKRTLEFITRWTVLYLIGSSGYFTSEQCYCVVTVQ
jgi:hypothetical protein